MKKKTLGEKFVDLMDSPGRAFLFWLAVTAAFGLLLPVTAGISGMPMLTSFMIMLAVFRKRKLAWVERFDLRLPNGTVIPYTVYREKKYMTSVVPVSFFCIFNYVPYGVRYHLVKGAVAPETSDPAIFTDITGLFRHRVLTKDAYLALRNDLQTLAAEAAAENAADRTAFLEAAQPFFKAGILREAFCGGYYSILTSPEKQDLCALCFYSGKRETQCAFAPDAALAERFRQASADPAIWQGLVACDSVLALDDATLETLLRANQKAASGAQPDAPAAQRASDGFDRAMEDLNARKTPLTDEVIADSLRTFPKWKTIGGVVLCVLASDCFVAALAGLGTGLFVLSIVFLPLFFLCLYYGVKKLRQGKAYKKTIRERTYRIEKATCTGTVPNGEGLYLYTFDNGGKPEFVKGSHGLKPGAPGYFVSLDEKSHVVFGGIDYYCQV